jgi:hypothetical protein
VLANFDKPFLLLTTIVAHAGNFRVETADVTYELPGLGGGGQGWGSSVGLHAIGECLHEAHTKEFLHRKIKVSQDPSRSAAMGHVRL